MKAAALRMCFAAALLAGGFLAATPSAHAEPITLPDGALLDKVDFERHVMGLLSRMGCNMGACHGSFQGKGGFYLSLFGYSPDKDHQAISRDQGGRRINVVNPDQSLLLLKATGQVPHGGGTRFNKDSFQYKVIRRWIAEGARWEAGSGNMTKVEIEPSQHVFKAPNETKKLKVWATFANGDRLEISQFSDFRVNDDYMAEVEGGGTVKALRPGDTTVVVTYRGNIFTSRVMLPVPTAKDFVYPSVPEVNYIDREVFAKLRTLNIVPSDLSSDSEFLRRIYLDTIGSLPPPAKVRSFLEDKDPQKRNKLIDELLAHPLHAALWATKFSDITGNNVDLMEQPIQLRPKRAKMWHDWLRVRFEANVPYDQLVKDILLSQSRDGRDPKEWVTEALTIEKQAAEGFETDYAKRQTLDLFWRRPNYTLEQMAEHTATAFLGVRIECAQCHKHPFDRWSQVDYRQYANIYSQVKFNISAAARQAINDANAELRKLNEGKKNNQLPQIREVFADNTQLRRLPHPDTNAVLLPRALGGPEFSYNDPDIRASLFNWMVREDNPFFAHSFVNRVWAHYFGVGLVEPVDSFAAANPPSNEKLLDALARDFIASKFDIRRLERTILQSRTYQLSSTPNTTNEFDRTNYSRSYPRRMLAEVMIDSLNDALGTRDSFGPDVPPNVRAIEIAPNRIQNPQYGQLFRIFGRPTRGMTCDCERSAEPALPQVLYLMTDPQLLGKIQGGRLRALLADRKTDAEVLDELFLATLSRYPLPNEKTTSLEHVARKGNRQAAFTDILWALINTREFVLNH